MNPNRRTFLKQVGIGAAGLSFAGSVSDCLAGPQLTRGKLPRSVPEAQGVSSEGILSFLNAVAGSKHEFHSFMLLRHGHVVAEGFWRPYRAEAPQMLYSLSKSFTSTGVGFVVAEGKLSVNDKVASFFPDELPASPSEHLTSLRIKDLLTMSVGHAQDSTGSLWPERDWVRKFLSLPIQNQPGSAFLYNSGATYMLSATVQKVTGEKLLDYLKPRLFAPLGIEGTSWESCPRGINSGGWGLKIQTEGLAKFGQLLLQKGAWNGKQILPASWVEEATSFKIQQPAPDLDRARRESDWHQGYCYQFWRCRHNAFRGDGAFGQFTVVMPEQDAVVVITSETPDMQGELNLVWKHLLPALDAEKVPAKKTQSQLKQRLGSLALTPPVGQVSSPEAARISTKTFAIDSNEAGVRTVSFGFRKNACVFSLEDLKGKYTVHCGIERWLDGQTSMPGNPPQLTQGPLPPVSQVAASGIWKDESTFEMTWRFYETPHHTTVTCRFQGDKLTLEYLDSIAAMSPAAKDKRRVLQGKLAVT